MKVVQLVTTRQYRGAEVFAAKLSEQLIQRGITVFYVGLYSPPKESLTVPGATNIDLNGSKKFLSFRTIHKLYKFLAAESPDIIQANGSDTLKYAIMARLLLRKRIPVLYRNISIMSAWMGSNFFKRSFYRLLFSQVDYVTSVGENSLNDLIELLDYPREKTKVIRRGIPIKQINKEAARAFLLKSFNLPEASRIVVHVGSFTPEKNQEFLIEVFKSIKTHTDIKLIMVGAGERQKHIEGLIQKHELNSSVYTAGFRKDIETFLAGAELLVLCSKVEGIPGVILEAGAQHTPSLAIDVGGVKEVVKHNKTGLVHSSHDVKSFVEILLGSLANKRHLEDLGRHAEEFVKTYFDSEQNAAIFVALYRDLTGRR